VVRLRVRQGATSLFGVAWWWVSSFLNLFHGRKLVLRAQKYHVNVSEMLVKFGHSAYACLALVRRFLRWEATAIPIFVEGHASS
jgi:hypothetical protein